MAQMLQKPIATLVLFMVLAQCTIDDTPSRHDALDACGARTADWMIGMEVETVALPEGPTLRVVGPNDFVTEDFRADRLNVYYNGAGTIERIDCG